MDSLAAYDEDFSTLIYYVESSDKYNILNDDEKGKDPEIKTTQEVVCSYSMYRDGDCTYNDWVNDKKVTVTKVTSKKAVNEEIREANDNLKAYDVYYFKNGKSEKIASKVKKVIAADYNTKTLILTKLNEDEKVKISDLKELDEFNDYVDEHVKNYYLKNGKDLVEIELPEDDFNISTAVVTKDLKGYIINSKSELYYIDIKNTKKGVDLVDTNASDLSVFKDTEVLYYCSNDKKDEDEDKDLKKASGRNTSVIASKVSNIVNNKVKKEDKDILYVYSECDDGTCIYSSYDGKLVKLLEDVNYVRNVNEKEFYVFKNYSSKNRTYDIYYHKNGKTNKIAFDIDYDCIALK